MKRDYRIFDTNVPVIANFDQSPQSDVYCQQACMEQITRLFSGIEFLLVLDMSEQGSEILREYRNNLRDSGSGIGDLFLRWISQHWTDEDKCRLVPITNQEESYAEFPDDRRLRKLDPADHKWIATACSHRDLHGQAPDIVQAADMKWKTFEVAFADQGIIIDFICDTSEDAVKLTKPNKKRTKKSK